MELFTTGIYDYILYLLLSTILKILTQKLNLINIIFNLNYKILYREKFQLCFFYGQYQCAMTINIIIKVVVRFATKNYIIPAPIFCY